MAEDKKIKKIDATKTLSLGIILNFVLALFEYIFGIFSGSLALQSTALNTAADSLSLIISLVGNWVSQKERTKTKTYGYGRANVLAAFINALLFIVAALFIFYESYKDLLNPNPIKGGIVIIVALIALAVKSFIALLLLRGKSINIKTVFLDTLFDALGLVCLLCSGIVISLTGFVFIDPLVSFIIGLLILYNGIVITKQTLNILFEGVPEHINVQEVTHAIHTMPKVISVDHIHIWAITDQYSSLSCHVFLDDKNLEDAVKTIDEIKKMLAQKFNITHTNIEPELKK